MSSTTIQDAISQADLAELRQAQYDRHTAAERASQRLDEASIASFRAAARRLQTLERRLENGRRALR